MCPSGSGATPAGSPGSNRLHPVALPQLWQQGGEQAWTIDQPIPELQPDIAVRGWMRLIHHGSVLEVAACASTWVERCCDRCLQPFRQTIEVDVQERLQLSSPSLPRSPASAERGGGGTQPSISLELEFALEISDPEAPDLDDSLDAQAVFDPEHWLFEQLSLQLPVVNRCGPQCSGPACWTSSRSLDDPRWAALRQWQADA